MLRDSSWVSFLDLADRPLLKKRQPYRDARDTGNGAEIIFRSVTTRNGRAQRSGAWLDEASLMHQDAYTIIIASLRAL